MASTTPMPSNLSMAAKLSPPTEMNVEAQQLERQRQMAYLMQQQGMTAPDGQMVSGRYVAPSATQYVSKLAQALLGRTSLEDADRKQADLAQRSNQMLIDGLRNYQSAQQGTPAQTITQDPQEVAQAFDTEGMTVPQDKAIPAQPGSKQAALAQLLQSGHPALQQLGMAEMLKKPESVFNKVDPKDFTQESVAKFAVTNNYADLVPARKMEVTTGGSVYNPYSVKPGTNFNDPNKLIQLDTDGNAVVNQPLVDAKKAISKAGATNVQVKTDVKTGESLAAQVGPMMKDSTSIADGAVKQVDAAQRVVKAIESGNVMTGPTTTLRLKGAQIAQMLGIGGKDDAERIANTRQTIRGFAELTLQGRQQMKGQGAITESEGALATKAMSGDIDDLTGPEIIQLAKASERAARFNYAEHTRKLKVMQENPALQGIAPFYQGPAMPAEAAIPAPNQPPQPGMVLRFDAHGNPIK
jgi:hypothetical protein